MKLAFCLFHYQLHSGLSRDFLAVAREAVARGHSVDVFTQSWAGDEIEQISVHLMPPSGLSNHNQSANFARACQIELERGNFDAVIGFNRMPGLSHYFAADLSFIEHARRKHGRLFKLTSRYKTYSKLERAVFSSTSTTHIFALNQRQRDAYQTEHNSPAERFTILPPAVDTKAIEQAKIGFNREQFLAEQGLPADCSILLMVGSNFKTKGVDRAIRALAALPVPLSKRCRLIVLGSGKTQAMHKLAQRQSVEHLTQLLGPRDDVFQWMLAADLLLQPSRVEAGGNSILEALAAGLPVIASDNCGFAEHLSNAQAGALVYAQTFSREEYREQFSELIASGLDANTAQQWRENARDYCARTPLSGRAAALLNTIESQASR